MANVSSTLATQIAAGKMPTNKTILHVLDDVASMPVATLGTTEYVRFGVLPAGAVIVPNLCYLTTDHTAVIAGKLTLVPLDGSAATDITGITVNLEATETTSFPDGINSPALTKASYVQFTPTGATTIATTAKNLWARITYRLLG